MTWINLTEISENWDREDDWRIAMEYCPFMHEGFRVQVGEQVLVHSTARIENWVVFGSHVNVGPWARVRYISVVGSHVNIGPSARIGPFADIRFGASIGQGVRVPDGAVVLPNCEVLV